MNRTLEYSLSDNNGFADDVTTEPLDSPLVESGKALLNSDSESVSIGPQYPSVGDRIEVYWPQDERFYEGNVTKHNPRTQKYSVNYPDGDKEVLKLQEEKWKYAEGRSEATERGPTEGAELDEVVENPLEAAQIQLSTGQELESKEREIIDSYFQAFGSREFMRHQVKCNALREGFLVLECFPDIIGCVVCI
ncbi:Histone-lysine N-methyltransferase TRX1 [Gracilariopsis chorda]|uniref:Histone-lysine N-methyltransferase TRX1 n=1 Tax=Gracilariopsis chorda TaxID=448386 RepID=A0A2V3IGG6_9FLOR|nr:Histone-lysine N-methyltransferase TRX1 [Gracilariopsis chorda]|eukprot:PXF41171.1 Histone-lysine N-methyltransferase TRX1 [Gracilariopsis chorda]